MRAAIVGMRACENGPLCSLGKAAMNRRGPNRLCRRKGVRRAGVSTLDYVLILGVILPMVAFMMTHGRAVIGVVYQMLCVLVSWPFM